MTQQERLIAFVVALVLASHVLTFVEQFYLARTYGPLVPLDVQLYWKNLSILIAALVNIGVSLWLYLEAKAAAARAWVWALFGLTFGIEGLIVFYLVRLYARSRATET